MWTGETIRLHYRWTCTENRETIFLFKKYQDICTNFFFLYPQIDIFSSEQKSTALMHLTHENLNSINSLNVFHPSVNMLAGGNSSGKVYLWTEWPWMDTLFVFASNLFVYVTKKIHEGDQTLKQECAVQSSLVFKFRWREKSVLHQTLYFRYDWWTPGLKIDGNPLIKAKHRGSTETVEWKCWKSTDGPAWKIIIS